jgi:hypothetical protein
VRTPEELLKAFVNAEDGGALMVSGSGLVLIDCGWQDGFSDEEIAYLVSLRDEDE